MAQRFNNDEAVWEAFERRRAARLVFPEKSALTEVRFQLDRDEKQEVVTVCDHLSRMKFSKSLPYAFTGHGAIMAATVLNSPEAVKMSLFVVRAFVKMREQLAANAEIVNRLAAIDRKLIDHDEALGVLWRKLKPLLAPPPAPPSKEIGFRVREKSANYKAAPRTKAKR